MIKKFEDFVNEASTNIQVKVVAEIRDADAYYINRDYTYFVDVYDDPHYVRLVQFGSDKFYKLNKNTFDNYLSKGQIVKINDK